MMMASKYGSLYVLVETINFVLNYKYKSQCDFGTQFYFWVSHLPFKV